MTVIPQDWDSMTSSVGGGYCIVQVESIVLSEKEILSVRQQHVRASFLWISLIARSVEYPKLTDKDLRRKPNDLTDEDATAESVQLWMDEVEFENVEESELSLDREGSLSIFVISVSMSAEDRRRHVRSIVAAKKPDLSISDNRADSFQVWKSDPLRLLEL